MKINEVDNINIKIRVTQFLNHLVPSSNTNNSSDSDMDSVVLVIYRYKYRRFIWGRRRNICLYR